MYNSWAPSAYGWRLLIVQSLNLACAFYVARFVRQRQPGWPRLLAAVPILFINCSFASLFKDDTEVISKALFLLCSFWISNFKLLALCLNRGSLVRPWTSAQFTALYLVPITPRNEQPGESHVDLLVRIILNTKQQAQSCLSPACHSDFCVHGASVQLHQLKHMLTMCILKPKMHQVLKPLC